MSSIFFNVDEKMVRQHSVKLMVYVEKHRLMDIMIRLLGEVAAARPLYVGRYMGKILPRIAAEIYRECKAVNRGIKNDVKFLTMTAKFVHRVVIVGRTGSGRKTQAISLAKRYGLVYLDAEILINYNLKRDNCPYAKELQTAFEIDENFKAKSLAIGKVINERVQQMDCIRNGWVVVNYPRNRFECCDMFETFLIPPNKLLYLVCPSLLALQRLHYRPKLLTLQTVNNSFPYHRYESEYFTEIEDDLLEYLEMRYETIYINATCCYEVVKREILANLNRNPYLVGYKS